MLRGKLIICTAALPNLPINMSNLIYWNIAVHAISSQAKTEMWGYLWVYQRAQCHFKRKKERKEKKKKGQYKWSLQYKYCLLLLLASLYWSSIGRMNRDRNRSENWFLASFTCRMYLLQSQSSKTKSSIVVLCITLNFHSQTTKSCSVLIFHRVFLCHSFM